MKPNLKYRFSPSGAYVPQVGNRVKIKNFTEIHNGMLGYIEEIDGGYIMVRPRWAKYIIELYHCEIDPAPYGR